MGLSRRRKSRDRVDPHRRRMSPDAFVERDQRIWAMRAEGYTIQEIADSVGCGLATVDRALKLLAARMADDDDGLGAELDAVLARYYRGLRCEEVRSADDVPKLNDLELYRLGFLPADHPARAAVAAGVGGWRWPAHFTPEAAASLCSGVKWLSITPDWGSSPIAQVFHDAVSVSGGDLGSQRGRHAAHHDQRTSRYPPHSRRRVRSQRLV